MATSGDVWNASDSAGATSTTGGQPETSTEYESCPSEESDVTNSPSCVFYSFVIQTVVVGLLGLFGTIGNVVSFLVFLRDKIKTSTSFLFQVGRRPRITAYRWPRN
jgi:hypothetical protein